MIQRSFIDTTLRFLLRSPRRMGENPFVGFLILLCLALVISSLVFYRYVFMARNEDVRGEITQVRFDQHKFQQLIQTWQERAEKFDEAGRTQIRDIFAGQETTVEEIEN